MNNNVIEWWITVDTSIPGRTAGMALADLNEELGTKYTHSTLSRWRRGEQSPRPAVLRYMARIAVRRVLMSVGIPWDQLTDEQLDAVADGLSPPSPE